MDQVVDLAVGPDHPLLEVGRGLQRRDAQLRPDPAEAIAEVIKEDTDLPDAEAHLLGMALSGMAQICARFWLVQGSSIPRDEAARLVATLSWRGLGGFPKIEREGSGSEPG